MVGVHAAFTCQRRDTREPPPAWLAISVSACTSTSPKARPTSMPVSRLEALAADDWLLVHCVLLDRHAAGDDRPQPAQQHEQRRRLRPPGPTRQRRRARHRRHRRRHARGVPPRLRRPPRRRRAGRARHGVELGDERLSLPPRVRRRPRDVDLRPRRLAVARRLHARDPGHRRGQRRPARCSSPTARRHGSTSPRSAPTPPSKPRACSPASDTLVRAPGAIWRPIVPDRDAQTPVVRCWPMASSYPVALYLQDAHPIREGIEYVRQAEAAGLRRRVAGRQPARARRRRADGRVRRGHRADQDRLGRHRHLDPQRGPPRQHVLDARRPRPGTDPVRPRRVVGPAGGQGRHRAGPAADGDARGRRRRARPARQPDR